MPAVAQPLIPKSGPKLQVIALGRISTIHQDAENIEASYRYIQDYLGRIYDGPLNIRFLGEQASGMRTDRRSILEAEELVASGTIDLVIAEDLSRIWRNPRYQFAFVQNAVDVGTRVICIGDNLDTADENWEITMGAAALRHGLHIPDTRRRVRRTATHCFHNGGMVQKVLYGYRKLSVEEAAAGTFGPRGLRIARRPECTPVIRRMAERLCGGASYASIADVLNAEGIATGPHADNKRWTGRLVKDLLQNPILSGTRTFRRTICRPVFRTGRHKAEKNEHPETETYPELAHLTPEMHARVLKVIATRRCERAPGQHSPPRRRGVPRKRSYWPGQAATCGICGGLLYYCGDHLRCAAALSRNGSRCWNRVQVPAVLARRVVLEGLLEFVRADRGRLEAFVAAVRQAMDATDARRRGRCAAVAEVDHWKRQAQHLSAAIAAGGPMEPLVERLQAVQRSLQQAADLACDLAADATADSAEVPLIDRLPQVVLDLCGRSYDFAEALRSWIPEFVVFPVQALDTPLVRPRGKVTFQVAADDASTECGGTQRRQLTLDLFEPPLHIRSVEACRRLREEHPRRSGRQIAALLKLNPMTVKRALGYLRRMQAAGMTDPYQELSAPPKSASRWYRATAVDA